MNIKTISENRQARHEYFIVESIEAGIELFGTEVKSIRTGGVNLKDSWISIENGEAFIRNMHIAPYEKGKPIYYEFTACPTAEFAKKHDLLEVMPALCNPDFAGMELIGARLVRKTTCSNGCKCDYTICASRDPYCKDHPEYRDEAGYRRNK